QRLSVYVDSKLLRRPGREKLLHSLKNAKWTRSLTVQAAVRNVHCSKEIGQGCCSFANASLAQSPYSFPGALDTVTVFAPHSGQGMSPKKELIHAHVHDHEVHAAVFAVAHQVLSAKLCQLGSQVPSSPESSSDSSVGSPQHQYEGPRPDAEACLPGVLMSRQPRYTQFLFKLADLGSSLQVPQLREGAMALLKILPADVQTVEKLRQHCSHQPGTATPSLDSLLRSLSPTELLYHLENPCSEEAQQFQCGFVQSGGVPLVLGMLTQERFLSGLDPSSR
ncbi:hypothetical protein HPB47_019532, partial [Ixodes persulcatus]